MPQPPLDATDVTVQRAVRLPSRFDDELRRRAELEDRPVSDLFRDALRRYLDEEATTAA